MCCCRSTSCPQNFIMYGFRPLPLCSFNTGRHVTQLCENWYHGCANMTTFTNNWTELGYGMPHPCQPRVCRPACKKITKTSRYLRISMTIWTRVRAQTQKNFDCSQPSANVATQVKNPALSSCPYSSISWPREQIKCALPAGLRHEVAHLRPCPPCHVLFSAFFEHGIFCALS